MLTGQGDEMVLRWYGVTLTAIIGLVVMGCSFAKMNRGIRQQNLKAITSFRYSRSWSSCWCY